jgi:hypothetical protein
VLVVLRHGHGHQRDLVLLVAVDHAQVQGRTQVRPARARAFGEAVLPCDLVLLAPAQRTARGALWVPKTPSIACDLQVLRYG